MKTLFNIYYILSIILAMSFCIDDLRAKEKEFPINSFVSLKKNKTNMRIGPSKDYPIRWEYHKKHLPVEIIDEHYAWRKIRDHDGAIGWIHKIMLTNTRNVIINKAGIHSLHQTPDSSSPAILRAEKGVIARVISCQPIWCHLQISGRKGWMSRDILWGIYEGEVF